MHSIVIAHVACAAVASSGDVAFKVAKAEGDVVVFAQQAFAVVRVHGECTTVAVRGVVLPRAVLECHTRVRGG